MFRLRQSMAVQKQILNYLDTDICPLTHGLVYSTLKLKATANRRKTDDLHTPNCLFCFIIVKLRQVRFNLAATG
jgi:hypothetical protein